MKEKINKINNKIVTDTANSIETIVGIVGFLLVFIVTPIMFLLTLGRLFDSDYSGLILFLILSFASYYLGKGIEKHLYHKKGDRKIE